MRLNRIAIDDKTGYSTSCYNWVLFCASVFFFMANLFASIAIFPAYSLYIGSTPFQAGLQNTAFGITAVLLRLFLGPVMDRQGPKPLMIVGIFSFATTPLLLLPNPSFTMLLIARVYQSLGLAVVLPGISTLVAEISPPGRVGTYLGSTRVFFNLALLSGPSSALFLIDRFGYSHWFIISSLTCMFSLSLLAPVKIPAVHTKIENIAGPWIQFKKVMTEKQIYPIIVSIALFSFTYSAVISFAAVHIETAAPGSEAAFFFVLLGFTGIVASLGAGTLSDRFSRQQVAWPMMIILGVGAVLFHLIATWPPLILICAIILGIGIQGSSLVFAAWLIDLSKPGFRATTISIQENTIDIFFAIGTLSFGLAAQGPGLGVAFLAAGILTIISTIPLSRKSAALLNRYS